MTHIRELLEKNPSRRGVVNRDNLQISTHIYIRFSPKFATIYNIYRSMTELKPSELGTQEFWDNQYALEIDNFKEHGDVGEIWFGEHIGKRIIQWLNKSNLVTKSDGIIDVGCGNGMLLVDLAEAGYENLLGVDYSKVAVKLAEDVAKEHEKDIKFKVHDLLVKGDDSLGEFDIVLDKGTYDAVSLSESAKANRLMYIENIHKMLKTNGIFIITSCNWTQEELFSHFTNMFSIMDMIPTPQFQFGGNTGKTVTSIVFKKV